MFYLVYCKGATYKFSADRFRLVMNARRFYVYDLYSDDDQAFLDIDITDLVSVRVKNTFSLRDKEVK